MIRLFELNLLSLWSKLNIMYTEPLVLKDSEIPYTKLDQETGEIIKIRRKTNNIPEGYSMLDYKDFSIVNNDIVRKLKDFITTEEFGVILYMISISDFNSNSLDPLCDELSLRDKAEILNIKKDKVKRITDRLFKLGVFLSIRVYEDQEKEYWVLNPYISWRGRLTKDSIFVHFKDCTISKLLK